MMRRREFLSATLAAGVASLAESKASAFRSSMRRSQSVDSRIEILLSEPIGKIAPEIYGHFAEHLGGVIYDGIWVGEDSRRFQTSAAFANRWSRLCENQAFGRALAGRLFCRQLRLA